MLTESDIQNTVTKAIGFFEGSREPHALLWLNVMHRLFRVEQFADALARYDAVLAEGREDAPVLRVLRRIADVDNPLDPDDLEHVKEQTDRMLISALYCDRYGLPPSFPEVLEKAVREGGYAATHGLLSLIWVREAGCQLNLPEGLVDRLYDCVASIARQEGPGMVNDLKLEAAAFLCLARQAKRIDLRFVQQVVRIQNADGGWGRPAEVDPEQPDRSSWHSTVLALLLLLHVHFP